MNDRFSKLFTDDLGAELLRRSYDLKIRLTRLGGETCGSFKLEGSLSLERPEDDAGDVAEDSPDELDVKLLRRLLAKFQEPAEK